MLDVFFANVCFPLPVPPLGKCLFTPTMLSQKASQHRHESHGSLARAQRSICTGFPASIPYAHLPRFTEGDQVGIAVIKSHFEKGNTPNWTEEVFVVDGVLPTRPITYRIRDLMDERVLGSFYEQQLQKTEQIKFRVEQVLRKRGQSLVKWEGYPDKLTSWIQNKLLEKL